MNDLLPNTAGAQEAKLRNANARADALLDAITYALDHADDGLEWLRAWAYGDPDSMAELERYQASQF